MKNNALLSWKKPMAHFRYSILSFALFIVFTGPVFALDQTELDIVCPDDTGTASIAKETQFFSDALEENDEQAELGTYSCFSAAPGFHYFKTYTFQTSTTDIYTFIGALTSAGMEAGIALFEANQFNVNNPCASLLGQKVMLQNSPESELLTANNRLSFSLTGGKAYTLMVFSLNPANATGTYNIFAFSENNGVLIDLPATSSTISLQITTALVCTDLEDIAINEPQHYIIDAEGMLISDSISEALQTLLTYTGFPDISNNCGLVDVWITDSTTDNGDCGTWTIARTFSITDRLDDGCLDGPYTNECTQIISIRKPTLEDVFLPPLIVTIPCDSDYPTDGEMGGDDENPHPSIAGYPFLITTFGYRALAPYQCTIEASYDDEPRIVICDVWYKYRRRWNFIDFCNPENTINFRQIIGISDDVGPIIEISIPDYNNDGVANEECLIVSTSAFSCLGSWTVPIPTLIDGNGCSGISNEAVVTIRTAAGSFIWSDTAGMVVNDLAIGDYEVRWDVSDDCGNKGYRYYCMQVRDNVLPTTYCHQGISVSLGGGDIINGTEGIGRLYPNVINNNSTDNCSDITLEVRRNFWNNGTCSDMIDRWSLWGEFTDFYCCDDNNEITVELRATDQAGNQNICTTSITVIDSLPPFCYSPADIYVPAIEIAMEFPTGITAAYNEDPLATINRMNTLLGMPIGTDNCAIDTIVEMAPWVNTNDCGTGTITRQFEVWQWRPEGDVNNNNVFDREEAWVSANTCTQTITLTVSDDFLLDFPQDAILYCGDSCIWTIQSDIDSCNLLTIIIGEPLRIPATGDECYQLSITYDVTNWGLWDGSYEGYIIPRMTEDGDDLPAGVVESTERPVLVGNSQGISIDRSNNIRPHCPDGPEVYAEDDDSSLADISCMNGDTMNADLCRGRWIYTQIIKVYDTIAPLLSVGEFGGENNLCPDLEAGQFCAPVDENAVVSIPFTISDSCNVFGIVEESSMLLVSAQLDLFAVDQNEDGVIDEAEFVAESGADGDVTANITNNNDGAYLFEGAYPFIPEGENSYHAIRILLEDDCGEQGSEIIYFDVQQEDPNAVGNTMGAAADFVLHQNRPNPFNNETIISFHIPSSSRVTIDLRDSKGRLIHAIKGDYLAGLNEVLIKKSMLRGINGVISYTITNEGFTTTRRMVVID